MSKCYVRLLTLTFLGSGLVPLVTLGASRVRGRLTPMGFHHALRSALDPLLATSIVLVLLATLGVYFLLHRLESQIENSAREQAEFIDSLPIHWVDLGILGSAALSLFLELALIRWQSSIFPFFAFYKNFSLLTCFAGLGLGYALAGRKRVSILLTIPLLCWEFLLMTSMRYGMKEQQLESLNLFPFREQLNMGLDVARKFYYASQVYFLLAIVFLITVLALLPVGQLCGALMQRREKLSAYGLNLLGSLAGVILMFLVSAVWMPPLVWFLLVFVGVMLFSARKQRTILLGAASATLGLIVLAWPVSPQFQRIYSPYQLLEIGYDNRGHMLIRAAGHYYQHVHNLAAPNPNADPGLSKTRDYYELPYRMYGHPKDIAVVGAGTGNDVAAALRNGAQRVDAIEIDPAIMMAGVVAHPEHPYSDPRVHRVINDARTFLRTTDNTYDMITYGLLDSHTLLSHASSVRLDSFVYTVEGLREARARLRPDGMISLSFAVLSDQLGRKIYLMMKEAFDGRPPLCVQVGYDGAVVFLESNSKDLIAPLQLLQKTGFRDLTELYADPNLRADVSTDDWPFFYMPRRVYPFSYLNMLVLVLVLSIFLIANFIGEAPQFSQAPFFLLGVGFMLVETKGITELGLTFGNSWQVIGVVISGIMVMAFLANCMVQGLNIHRPAIPYLLLMATLLLGWAVARHGGLPSTWVGRIGTAAILTFPMFFSGIVFSTLLRSRGEIPGIMAANLFGAMCGGLLEYNSMYFGFQFLYLIAGGCYLLAFAWELLRFRAVPKRSLAAATSK